MPPRSNSAITEKSKLIDQQHTLNCQHKDHSASAALHKENILLTSFIILIRSNLSVLVCRLLLQTCKNSKLAEVYNRSISFVGYF